MGSSGRLLCGHCRGVIPDSKNNFSYFPAPRVAIGERIQFFFVPPALAPRIQQDAVIILMQHGASGVPERGSS